MKFDFVTGDFLEIQNAPDRLAVVGTDRRLSWEQLRLEVDALCAALEKQGCRKPHPVMILGHKEAGMISSILACLKARIPYIPVDTIMPSARVEKICAVAQVQAVIHASGLNVKGRGGTRELWKGAEDLAYIMFTSGSSGEPKGVQISRANVADFAQWTASADFAFGGHDVMLNQCSFSFDVSFFDTVAALQCGAGLILNGPEELELKDPFRGRLGGLTPTQWSSTPSFLSLALTSAEFDQQHFPKLKRFYLVGEVVHPMLVKRLWNRFPDGELWNAYGPTEATVITTLIHVTKDVLERYPNIPIGVVKPGVTMPTSASDGKSEGELSIVGRNVSPGYLNRPDLNLTRFKGQDQSREYLTGDIGYHQDGLLFFKGRADDQIKLHGYRIELDEIDNQLKKLAEVDEAATVGLRRNGDVKKLVCFIKFKGNAAPGESETLLDQVREKLKAQVPAYMIPADFKIVKELPYNVNHKVDKPALIKQLENPAAEA